MGTLQIKSQWLPQILQAQLKFQLQVCSAVSCDYLDQGFWHLESTKVPCGHCSVSKNLRSEDLSRDDPIMFNDMAKKKETKRKSSPRAVKCQVAVMPSVDHHFALTGAPCSCMRMPRSGSHLKNCSMFNVRMCFLSIPYKIFLWILPTRSSYLTLSSLKKWPFHAKCHQW